MTEVTEVTEVTEATEVKEESGGRTTELVRNGITE